MVTLEPDVGRIDDGGDLRALGDDALRATAPTPLDLALGRDHLAALFFAFTLYPGVLEGVAEYRTL